MEKINSPEFENLSIQQKEEIILHHKRNFIKKVAIAIVALSALIALTVFALKIRKEMIQDRVRFVSNPPAEIPVVITPEENPETEKEYSNTTLQISFRYPVETKLTESFDTEKGEGKIEVLYSKDNNFEFLEGYKVTITVFSTKIRDLNQFAATRLEAMRTVCPESAIYSGIGAGKMGQYDSLYYQIDYCNGYYRNYYISFGGKFFEVSRFFKGDIGFRQQYETTTIGIINTITLLPQRFEITEFLKSVLDAQSGVAFEYPSHLVNNCSIPMPTETTYRVILSMCEENQKEAGVIIAVKQITKEATFESALQTEINKMSDDFFAAKGYPPKGIEERYTYNGESAVKITGYSWKDAYYIFVNTTSSKGEPQVILIGVKEGSPEFKTTIDNILSSIKFRQ
ncbi:MAG: hypothetical protein UU64_C0011G0056 [candidate division WWE3 bacterium GW2011_GWF2_41_45]|uniref:Uncharacterized protein n=3 Tax=Katanobacteria TaxID=422282 RepID=A0A1F4W1Z7_UNCKA|nr:MAG: hypothetical protein UU55_C0012G0056 [candidate division WWE3 bacterium GW2011_GWC2_41_23]KKS10039.1 MAG: hypothetical protein UU64_C0011G0056 [candidate division WWE3 bacterium GW2011_GWF2_41_45]KKS11999.1 MAG: hypothetical protein UU68_C0007G0056 [candidate division WWE3 bacterium GW2011_GWF1_41_53]KKS19889.1 MAG: hypothetical protein UU79_C0008G0056 [candidate division WWE3 bacterium GW2011_GWE1_41_72]KKS27040.1 MAG: hypothetical protein UU86_C0026G0006 [candidate division WWE3 bacte